MIRLTASVSCYLEPSGGSALAADALYYPDIVLFLCKCVYLFICVFCSLFLFQDDAPGVLHSPSVCAEVAGRTALVPGAACHLHLLPWKRRMELPTDLR